MPLLVTTSVCYNAVQLWDDGYNFKTYSGHSHGDVKIVHIMGSWYRMLRYRHLTESSQIP